MVVSDGSTDGTDQVLTRLALRDARITFIRQEPRAGKTAALNPLLERARSEIIVLADANLMYRPDTVRCLVAPFADPYVGVDAIRCSLYRSMRPERLPDFVLPLVVVEQGCRVVYAPEAVLEDETLTSESAEYRMCVRVALRGPPRLREFFRARYCYYFLLPSWASAAALVRFLRGEKQVLWQPRTG
jgi:glycosyltransferase involved in cell wall biosynthesis